MRKLVIFLLAAVLVLSGCAAYYGNERQYEAGDWYFLAGSREVARIRQDKLALAKLKASPVQTGSVSQDGTVIDLAALTGSAPTATSDRPSAGYRGLVVNLSTMTRYKFEVSGPETKSWYLGPGDRIVDYLIPGRYVFKIFYGGQLRQPPSSFNVTAQRHSFMKEEYHWYIGAEY